MRLQPKALPGIRFFSILALFASSPVCAQQLTHTCKLNKGPRAGLTLTYPAAQPIPVGAPCQDGVTSTGVAVPDNPHPQLTHSCKFDLGPRAGQTQVYSVTMPVGITCWDGVASHGFTVADKASAPEPAQLPVQNSTVAPQEQNQPTQPPVNPQDTSRQVNIPVRQNGAAATPASMSTRPASGPLDTARMTEILGTWQGVYFIYPTAMRIDLDLRSSSTNQIEGEVQFAPLVQGQRNLLGPVQGSYRVKGQYDPTTRTFAFVPSEWIQRPSQPATALKMSGVFDQRTGSLAGTFSTLTPGTLLYFALARPDRAVSEFLDPMKRISQEAQPNTRPRFGGVNIGGGLGRPLGGRGEDIRKIADWASRLDTEYPKLNYNNTYASAIPAQNLFEDSYFEAHFGKTYDHLSAGDLAKIAYGFRSYLGDRRNEESQLRQRYAFLQRYFEGFNIPTVLLGVLAQRTLRSWRDDTLERLHSLPVAADSFAQIDAMDEAAQQQLSNLWPSERTAIAAEMDATRGRLADPVLTASAQEAVQSAMGYEGAETLASWESRQQAILRWVSGQPKQQALDRVHARLDKLLTGLMADELKRTESFGRGAAALAKERAWVSDVRRRYAFAMERPPVVAALSQVRARRAQDLADAQSTIAAEINDQRSTDDIDRLVASYFILPDDMSTQPGSVLVNRARERRETLANQSAVAEARRHRAAVLGISESMLEKIPEDSDGPNVVEMYDALQERVDAYNENMKETIARCRAGGFQNDPILAIQCVAVFPVVGNSKYDLHATITHFRKVKCARATGEPGFTCDYIVGLDQSNPIMNTSLGDLLRAGGVAEARFLHAGSGWIMITPPAK